MGKTDHAREYLFECFEYNPETGQLTWKVRPEHHFKVAWMSAAQAVQIAGKVAGHPQRVRRTDLFYLRVGIGNKLYQAHQIIWTMMNGAIPPKMLVDHIDGNGLNNRLLNLRLVDHVGNAKNARLPKNSTTGVCGVMWNKQRLKWQVHGSQDGRKKHLGLFDTLLDAVATRLAFNRNNNYHALHGTRKSLPENAHV